MSEHRFRVTVGADEVAGVLHLPAPGPGAARSAAVPCVVACHGMGASKESDKYLLLGRELPAAGLALARFDFRGSGESGGRHEEATIESRVADVEAVLDHLAKRPEIDGRFGLLGSSLGGYVALWVAATRAGGAPLPVVTWNAPASLRDLPGADPEQAGRALVAEVLRGERAEAPAGVARVLVIQADRDEVVPPAHGRLLFARAAEPRALHVIAGADHRLTDPGHRAEALARSRDWLTRHLSVSHAAR
ncbi:MAG TPA: alpha/beta fold hydrolase [Methylomirabilota bacterium]|nr:alpha/beta fold hydrolase [Methylomirabilota bacterium]